MAEFYRKKKKICQMCAGKSVDYKDVAIINKYIISAPINPVIALFLTFLSFEFLILLILLEDNTSVFKSIPC